MKLLLSVFISAVFSLNGFSQSPELVRSHYFEFDDIDYSEFRNSTNYDRSGNLVALSEERALLQLGRSDIMVIELDSGRIERRINMHELLPWVTESLHEHRGEEFCVPGRESFHSRVKPEFYAIRFDRIVEYPGEGLYASLTHSVVLNQEKDNERNIFRGVLVFEEDLEVIDFHALKGHKELTRHPSMNSGGFFHEDTLFIRDNPYYNDFDYEFIKFEKGPEGHFQMVDTMNHWQVMERIGGSGFFHHAVKREGEFHLPLGQKVMILQNWSDSGVFRELPLDSDQFIHTMDPIGPEGWSIAWVVNRIYTRHGEPTSLEGYVSLMDPDYRRILHQEYYHFRDQRFLSVSVLDSNAYLLFLDNRKRFKVEVFDLVEGRH